MKKLVLLLLAPLALAGCKSKEKPEPFNGNDYGAFLGRIDNDVSGFNQYKYVSVELNEFTHTNIQRLTHNGTNFLAYLNVGSLENYRDYYDEFESLTFKDYDNWPEERWIDVTNQDWQNLIVSLAEGFKNEGAFGVYMDNVDVYSIAKEDNMNYQAFGSAIKNMITSVSALGLKEVFSLIDDYDENIFTTQNDEDKAYYQEVAAMMKSKGKEVFFLEYTTNDSLKETIKNYCNSQEFHYYIANTVELL